MTNIDRLREIFKEHGPVLHENFYLIQEKPLKNALRYAWNKGLIKRRWDGNQWGIRKERYDYEFP